MTRKDCDRTKGIANRTTVQRAAIVALLAWASPALAGSVSLWREAVVTDDDVRIADVCRLEGLDAATAGSIGDLVVRESPQVGGSIIVTVDEVRRALADGGANLATIVLKGAAHCDVTRPKRVESRLPADGADASSRGAARSSRQEKPTRTLRDAIEAFLQDDLGVQGATVHVQFGRTTGGLLELSEPEYTFDIKRSTGRKLGLVGLNVTVVSGSEPVQEVPVLVEVSFTKPTVVAARAINVGATISPLDVRVVDMTFDQRDRVGAGDPDAIVGQRAKRFIPAGQIVSARDIEPVPLVKRGQVVSVHSQVGGVSIVTAAKALSSGTYGDAVELRTGERGARQFTGTVTGPGRVRIDGSAQSGEAFAMGATQ